MKVMRPARVVRRMLVDIRLRKGRYHVRRLTRLERAEVLGRCLAGEDFRAVAAAYGFCVGSVRRILAGSGGFHLRLRPRAKRNLSLAEREEISKGLAAGMSFRAIARTLGRAPSTISREVNAKGKRTQYRAWWADEIFVRQSVRPKLGKIARHPELQRKLTHLFQLKYSPQQISATLKAEHPHAPEMQVSPETIYRSLFVQGRGELRRELTRYLRTGRARRYPQSRSEAGGSLGDVLTISQRPAEVEDRAVPGHWEGDLLLGKNGKSAIGTLVERKTRFVMLLRLGRDRTAETVRKALTARILELPEQLRRTLTWDRGKEMAQHARFSVDTNVKVYFCDPHSPWQRGSNENTNGLLRQYFPKGTALSGYSQQHLDDVANELNGRPRMTLGWKNPGQAFAQAVAMTA